MIESQLKNICIVQQASELLIKSLKVEKSVIWENIIFPSIQKEFQYSFKPYRSLLLDRWFKPTAKSKECFLFSQILRGLKTICVDPPKTLFYLLVQSVEKSYKNFVEFAGVQNLTPVSLPSYCDQRLYIDSILRAEYVWCV